MPTGKKKATQNDSKYLETIYWPSTHATKIAHLKQKSSWNHHSYDVSSFPWSFTSFLSTKYTLYRHFLAITKQLCTHNSYHRSHKKKEITITSPISFSVSFFSSLQKVEKFPILKNRILKPLKQNTTFLLPWKYCLFFQSPTPFPSPTFSVCSWGSSNPLVSWNSTFPKQGLHCSLQNDA